MGVPPVAASDCEYTDPTVAVGNAAVVIERAGPTVMVRAWLAVSGVGAVVSVTCTVKWKVRATESAT